MQLFTQINKDMMNELKEIKKAVKPTEVLLVVDAMTGQEAAGKPTQKTSAFGTLRGQLAN